MSMSVRVSWCVLVWMYVVRAQVPECCSKASGSCRSACEQISLVVVSADPEAREDRMGDVRNYCSPQLGAFWQCMNETLDELRRGEDWWGRWCCPLARAPGCQRACVSAALKDDLSTACRLSDELPFFTCLDRQEMGSSCCGGARSADCHDACRAVFRSQQTPSRAARTAVVDSCTELSPRVLQCARNLTDVTPATNPHKYLHCCEKTSDSNCRDACRRILRTRTTSQEIVDSLEQGGCGPPMPHEGVWQCFLQSPRGVPASSSRIDRLGMDAAKLHCCGRASSNTCRRLCFKTFSTEWARAWDGFDRECLALPSEQALAHCVDEVEEPCELGCGGLSYCTNFNNRPTDLFRSCSDQADKAARFDVDLWQHRGLLLLPELQLPLLNVTQCLPASWKAVACALQMRPCDPHAHASRICKDDCFELLSRCVDWSQVPSDQSAASLCARLSPDHPSAPCISLEPFLQPSPHSYQPELTSPCRGNPCNSSEVCTPNQNCVAGRSCQPYQCTPGCKLGEVSQYMVPQGSYVRIPLATGSKGCLKICQCSATGVIEQCQPMPCYPLSDCFLGSRKIDHGTAFYVDCNVCVCFGGDINCSKRQCEVTLLGGRDPAYTGLPCNCPPDHVPVCGHNGNTYPSSCLAKCADLTDADFNFGACSSLDPCASKPCAEDEVCYLNRKVCLSLLHRTCTQYQCLPKNLHCTTQPPSPVCDTEGRDHPHVCSLQLHNKSLAYRGRCLVGCNTEIPMCGMDGNTYHSECAALANQVAVDYAGACTSVGTEAASPRCKGVICPPLARPGCVGATAPGACCPVCAGAVRFLLSVRQVELALFALHGQDASSQLTLSATLSTLQRHVAVAQCAVRGQLTSERVLFVLVQPNARLPTDLQLEACVREAEKLASLVRRGSPRVASELSLGALATAVIAHGPIVNLGLRISPQGCVTIFFLSLVVTSRLG